MLTLTRNIREYWTLRKTGKKEYQGGNLLRRKQASYQWNIIQTTKYLEINTTRKQNKKNILQKFKC